MDEPTWQDVIDAVTDLGRIVTRQSSTLDTIASDVRAAMTRDRAGADIALLVDLLSLHRDATACAGTARAAKDRRAFAALADQLERVLTGRGGTLVSPAVGHPFDAATMEVADVVGTSDPALDRTVESVRAPGLVLSGLGRSVRPARVVVRQVSRGR